MKCSNDITSFPNYMLNRSITKLELLNQTSDILFLERVAFYFKIIRDLYEFSTIDYGS